MHGWITLNSQSPGCGSSLGVILSRYRHAINDHRVNKTVTPSPLSPCLKVTKNLISGHRADVYLPIAFFAATISGRNVESALHFSSKGICNSCVVE